MAGPPGFGRILSRLLITLTPHSSERIAIGSGTDVAIESGEIVLIRDDLMDTVAAVQPSRMVMARVKPNIFRLAR